MGRRRCIAIAGLVFGIVTAACNATVPSASPGRSGGPAAPSEPPGSPAASLPTTGHIVATDRGFSVTIPAGWTRVDIGPDTMAEIERIHGSALAGAEQTALDNTVKRYQAVALLDRLSSPVLAIRVPSATDSALGFIAVANVRLTGTVTPDQAEATILSQLRSTLNAKITITTSHVSGPAGRFLRIAYDAAIAGTTTNIGVIAYDVIGPASAITVTCTTFGPGSTLVEPCAATALSSRFEPETTSSSPKASPSN